MTSPILTAIQCGSCGWTSQAHTSVAAASQEHAYHWVTVHGSPEYRMPTETPVPAQGDPND